ncbi:MAG: FAD-binding protein [Acidobacteria bacterium]|nr:FAD-binding protein [Acidobacteriota bacterium]
MSTIDRREYDVVCIGGGGAGIAAATTAARNGAKVALLSKEPLGYGNTRIAAGIKVHPGITAGDSENLFYEDMLAGGEYLNNPRLARIVAKESRLSSQMLESFGYTFRRDDEGLISVKVARRSGGHSLIRSLVPFPYGGVPIGSALRSAGARGQWDVFEEVVVTRLLTEGNQIRGLVLLHTKDGTLEVIAAKAVVLTTGGAGWLYYPHTDCSRVCTGDGYALALNAGAELVDMEQVQFIPFAVTHPRSLAGMIIGDPAAAGPHGRLLDKDGNVVATEINVMTRAQVAVIISREVERGRGAAHGGLLLDLSPNFASEIGRRYLAHAHTNIAGLNVVKRAYGPQAFKCEEPWEVLPSAHFIMGGVVIDEWGRTSVKGLYAAGEVAGGIHGANRLGSVALSDILIFGRRAGEDAAKYAAGADAPLKRADDIDLEHERISQWHAKRGARPVQLVRRLQTSMWTNVGLVRDQDKGMRALSEIDSIEAESAEMGFRGRPGYCTDLQDAFELAFMLQVARATARSALERRESRGAHARSDYPMRDDKNWLANIFVRGVGKSMLTAVRRSAAASEAIAGIRRATS